MSWPCDGPPPRSYYAKTTALSKTELDAMSITAECGSCHKRFKANDKLVGRIVKCPHCGGAIEVAPTAVPDGGDGLYALAAEKPANRCPSCDATMNEDAILCVLCGYDVRTGLKIATEGSVRSASPASGAAKRKPEERGFHLAADLEVEGSDQLAACFRTVCAEFHNPNGPQSSVETPFYALSVAPGRVALVQDLQALRALLCANALSPQARCRKIHARGESAKLDPTWAEKSRETSLAALLKAEYGSRAFSDLRSPRMFERMDYVDSLQPYLRNAYLASLYSPKLGWAAVRGIVWGNAIGSVINIVVALVVSAVIFVGFLIPNPFPYNLIVALLWGAGFAVGHPIGAVLGYLSGPGDDGVPNPEDWEGIGPDRAGLAKIVGLPVIGAALFAAAALITALAVHSAAGLPNP